jgi:peptidoglycan/LPS O-acetylase OafA/YrhL
MLLTSFFRAESGFVPTVILIVSAMAGIIIAMSGQVLRWLVNFFICYIGRISYSCYLAHFAALGITLRLFGIHLTNEVQSFNAGSSFSNLFLFLKIWLVTLGLTAVISTATLHLIENPGISLGRRLIDWITSWSGRPQIKVPKAPCGAGL